MQTLQRLCQINCYYSLSCAPVIYSVTKLTRLLRYTFTASQGHVKWIASAMRSCYLRKVICAVLDV